VLLAGSEAGKVSSRPLSSSLCNLLVRLHRLFWISSVLIGRRSVELLGHDVPRFAASTLFVTGKFRAGNGRKPCLLFFFLWPLGRMHQAAKLQFERTVREFAQWRAVPEADRSPAPAWSWQPAMEVVAQHEVRLLKTPCITVVAAAHLRSSLYWQAALADRFGHSRRTSERANHVHRPAPPFEPSACRNARNASRDKPAPCRHCAAASITAPF
jgi:hypothetical protein